MSAGSRIRDARAEDIAAIMAIETAEFTSDAWSVTMMTEELASEHNRYFVAENTGDPTVIDGYAGLFAPTSSTEGDVQTIAVAGHARRRGLGRALMDRLAEAALERGMHELFLEVRADNPGARTLYENLGYRELGVRPGYYQPDNVDAIVMKLALSGAERGIGR